VKAFSPEQVNRKSSRGVKAPQTDKLQAIDKQIGSIELDTNNNHTAQLNKNVPRLFNAAAISQ